MSAIFEDKHLTSYPISKSDDDEKDGAYAYEYSGCQSPVLKQLFAQSELQDLQLSGEDGYVLVHASVASIFSPVFKTAILSSFKEGKERKIDVSPYTISTLEQFRNFIYKGMIVIRRSTVFEILQFAHEYQIVNMYSLCEKFLATRQNLSASLFTGTPNRKFVDANEKMKYYIKAFKCGIVYGSKAIKECAEEELCAVAGGFAACPEFLNLDKKFILSLMLPDCNSEYVLAALTAWLLFESGRETSVIEILTMWGSTFLDFEKIYWPYVLANEFFSKNKKYESAVYEMLGRHYVTSKSHSTKTEPVKNRSRSKAILKSPAVIGFNFGHASLSPQSTFVTPSDAKSILDC